MSGLVLAAVVVLAVTCMVVLLVMRAQLYNRDHGTVPMVAWLVADNTKLRAALRGAGIAVDDDDEDVATGKHAAKGAR